MIPVLVALYLIVGTLTFVRLIKISDGLDEPTPILFIGGMALWPLVIMGFGVYKLFYEEKE